MNCRILYMAAMSALAIGAAFANSPNDMRTPMGRLVNESLDGFGYTVRKPVEGEIWELCSSSITVCNVMPDGVLAMTRQSALDSSLPTKTIFVKTSRTYADGDVLAIGYYRAIGTFSYEAVNHARHTVYAFEELSATDQKEVTTYRRDKAATIEAQRQTAKEIRRRAELSVEFKKSKERIAAEEAAEKARVEREREARENAHEIAKLKAESDKRIAALQADAEVKANQQKAEHAREMARLLKEREAQDKINQEKMSAAKAEEDKENAKLAVEVQKERERYARDVLSSLDLNFKHCYVIQRSIRKNLKIEVVDPAWRKLIEMQKSSNWLGMLSTAAEEDLEEFPDEKEIDRLLKDLRERGFTVKTDRDHRVGTHYISWFNGNDSSSQKIKGWCHGWQVQYDIIYDGGKYAWYPWKIKYYIVNKHENTFPSFVSRKEKIDFSMEWSKIDATRKSSIENEYEEWLKAN